MPDTNTRRDALKKLGLFGLAFAAPTVATIGESTAGESHGGSHGGWGGSRDRWERRRLKRRNNRTKRAANKLPYESTYPSGHSHNMWMADHYNHRHTRYKVKRRRRKGGGGCYSMSERLCSN